MTNSARKLKPSNLLFFLPSVLLVVGYYLKIMTLPNQLLFTGFGFLLILIFLIIFLVKQLKKPSNIGLKLIHFLFFPINLIVIILPYFNSEFTAHLFHFDEVFNKGITPFIHVGLAIVVAIYFVKINENNYSFSSFTQQPNYRNFVLLNAILFYLNSPFIRVIPDNLYSPKFKSEYEKGKGPTIYIDEAHNNQHTLSGNYSPFANILIKDGYEVKPFTKKFTNKTLEQVKILVICNALNEKNIDSEQHIYSAFDDDEIKIINTWIKNGGSLFLIADHAPFAGASKKLAAIFGFEFNDGYAEKKVSSKYPSDLFCRSKSTLTQNAITDGRNSEEFIDSIVTYVGQAFKIPDSAKAILLFNGDYVLNSSQMIGNIEHKKTESITGFSQGAVLVYGKGRVAAFGEASMFTGQLPAGLSWVKRGFNNSEAKSNYKLLLNIVHWLDNNK